MRLVTARSGRVDGWDGFGELVVQLVEHRLELLVTTIPKNPTGSSPTLQNPWATPRGVHTKPLAVTSVRSGSGPDAAGPTTTICASSSFSVCWRWRAEPGKARRAMYSYLVSQPAGSSPPASTRTRMPNAPPAASSIRFGSVQCSTRHPHHRPLHGDGGCCPALRTSRLPRRTPPRRPLATVGANRYRTSRGCGFPFLSRPGPGSAQGSE